MHRTLFGQSMRLHLGEKMMLMNKRTLACLMALYSLNAAAAPDYSASISEKMDVRGTPTAVWSAIGEFCAIKEWLPPVGTCILDGKKSPTRTLVTKDGSAAFVEFQTARNDAKHFYSYRFLSSPLPIEGYTATISVAAKSAGVSTVTWQGSYTPDKGKEHDAHSALLAIYDAGLNGIKEKLEAGAVAN